MIHDTQSAQISQKQDRHNIYVIMKTMCPPDITTMALLQLMHLPQVHELPQSHCGDNRKGTLFYDYIYIYIYKYINIYIYIYIYIYI